ncbi:MAG: ATP synthase epsilon chain [Candidatus Poribacteria bacterium]|nr:MAG: ATP synthase epsilon chain [Candidatus Poribacteria bacterium]
MRAEGRLELRILTPSRMVFPTGPLAEAQVLAVRVPGALSPFEVLPRHAPILSSLEIGEVRITRGTWENPIYEYLAVAGGVVEVLHNRVILLSPAVEWAHEIDVERAEAARERALNRLRHPTPETDLDRAQAALMRALNRLKVAGHALEG